MIEIGFKRSKCKLLVNLAQLTFWNYKEIITLNKFWTKIVKKLSIEIWMKVKW